MERLDASVIALIFTVTTLAFWTLGCWWVRRSPPQPAGAPGSKFTDASMVLSGLLLA